MTSYEDELWVVADGLRGSLNFADYKHVVLGLIFLKHISDAFEERRASIRAKGGRGAADDPNVYISEGIAWVPPQARWTHLRAEATRAKIGQLVDDAMAAVERENPSLKGVLPQIYAQPTIRRQRLDQLIDVLSNIPVQGREAVSRNEVGRIYDHLLSRFAKAEGKRGGEFYTPRCVARLLVEMLQPCRGRIYDPCCGAGGMFVQVIELINGHGRGNGNCAEDEGAFSLYGQEADYGTWRLARMNLAIRGIDNDVAYGNSFHNDRHSDLKADFILAHPPFDFPDWDGKRLNDSERWRYGTPPEENANFAWAQHIVHHLGPKGIAGVVLANTSMSSSEANEREIRKNLIEADLVDCLVALPGQLFYSTQLPACLWFLARERDRFGEVLFMDARRLGRMVDRTHRELSKNDIARIAQTYQDWRGGPNLEGYSDVSGFCKSVPVAEIRRHDHLLPPGHYVGEPTQVEDDAPVSRNMKRLIADLRAQQTEGARLDALIASILEELGFDMGGGRPDV